MPTFTLPTKPKTRVATPVTLLEGGKLVNHAARDYADKGADDLVQQSIASCGEAVTATAAKIAQSVNAIMQDATCTEIMNAKRARDTTFKAMQSVLQRAGNCSEQTGKAIADLTRQTQPPAPKDAIATIRAGEIRGVLRAMSREDRATALAAAIEDPNVIGAVASGPPMLTGMTDAEQRMIVEQWRMRHHKPTVERIGRLNACLATLDRMAATLQQWGFGLHEDRRADIEAAEAFAALATKAMNE